MNIFLLFRYSAMSLCFLVCLITWAFLRSPLISAMKNTRRSWVCGVVNRLKKSMSSVSVDSSSLTNSAFMSSTSYVSSNDFCMRSSTARLCSRQSKRRKYNRSRAACIWMYISIALDVVSTVNSVMPRWMSLAIVSFKNSKRILRLARVYLAIGFLSFSDSIWISITFYSAKVCFFAWRK